MRNSTGYRGSISTVGVVMALLWTVGVMASDTPDRVVRQATEGVLNALKDQRARIDQEPARVYEIVEEFVLPHVDTTRMSRWVLGKHWRGANLEQRRRFEQAFQALLLRTYINALRSYTDQSLRFKGSTGAAASRKRVVTVEIVQHGAPATQVSFNMHHGAQGWLVYDVKIEGVSLVSNYRSNFAALIRKDGLDKLIGLLEGRNRELAAQT